MVRVLIADNDLDSHELVDDIVEMIFRDVKIDRALSRESLYARIGAAEAKYDLVLFNYAMQSSELSEILDHVRTPNPLLEKRIVFITSEKTRGEIPESFPVLFRPFSLDAFSDVVMKTSAQVK